MYVSSAQNNQNARTFGRPFSVFDSTEQELYSGKIDTNVIVHMPPLALTPQPNWQVIVANY